jgi:hypothetical protein
MYLPTTSNRIVEQFTNLSSQPQLPGRNHNADLTKGKLIWLST